MYRLSQRIYNANQGRLLIGRGYEPIMAAGGQSISCVQMTTGEYMYMHLQTVHVFYLHDWFQKTKLNTVASDEW